MRLELWETEGRSSNDLSAARFSLQLVFALLGSCGKFMAACVPEAASTRSCLDQSGGVFYNWVTAPQDIGPSVM